MRCSILGYSGRGLSSPEDFWPADHGGLATDHTDWQAALGASTRGVVVESRNAVLARATSIRVAEHDPAISPVVGINAPLSSTGFNLEGRYVVCEQHDLIGVKLRW